MKVPLYCLSVNINILYIVIHAVLQPYKTQQVSYNTASLKYTFVI